MKNSTNDMSTEGINESNPDFECTGKIIISIDQNKKAFQVESTYNDDVTTLFFIIEALTGVRNKLYQNEN